MGAALPVLLLTNMEGAVGHHVGDSNHKRRGSLVLTLKETKHPKKKDSWLH